MAVALHPAIDRTIAVPRLRSGAVLRGRLLMVEPAGKGPNIIHTLSNLGHDVLACGFLGRSDARFFLDSMKPRRVTPSFITVDGEIRQNITLIETDKRADTHILSGRMRVGRQDVRRLIERLARRTRAGDWAVFSGSAPAGVRQTDYLDALRACGRRGAKVSVDASGPLLRAALRVKPWLIKPNREELEELTGRRLRSLPRLLNAARGLLDRCERALVSLGPEGALLVAPEGAWRAQDRRKARVVHTVGCGDALLAGFLSAYARGRSPAQALRYGVACGSACVRSPYAAIRSAAEPARRLPAAQVARLQW